MKWIWSEKRPGRHGSENRPAEPGSKPAEGASPLRGGQNEVDLEREEAGKQREGKDPAGGTPRTP